MSQIEISCVGSTAVFTNTPDIFSGGNVDEVKFIFDKEWDNFTNKTAVFYTNPKETVLQLLDEHNVAKIPQSVLFQKGKLSIGVIGTDEDDVKTSKILTYVIGKGAVTNDMETTPATPDIWLQLLSIVTKNKQVVDDMNLIVDESQLTNKANKDLSNISLDTFAEKGLSRIKIGSYTGTGLSGSDNACTLNFDFRPFLVFIFRNGSATHTLPVSTYTGTYKNYAYNSTGSATASNYAKFSNNTLSWYYSGSSATDQLNVSGDVYHYMAIG